MLPIEQVGGTKGGSRKGGHLTLSCSLGEPEARLGDQGNLTKGKTIAILITPPATELVLWMAEAPLKGQGEENCWSKQKPRLEKARARQTGKDREEDAAQDYSEERGREGKRKMIGVWRTRREISRSKKRLFTTTHLNREERQKAIEEKVPQPRKVWEIP